MAKKTIKIKNYSDIMEEYVAVATITPGMLVEYTSAGEVQAHSSAGQNAVAMVAVENALEGEGIDDDYAEDDQVQVWIPGRGDQAYMILADGNDVSKGDLLESAGDGSLQKHTADVESAGSNEPVDFTSYSNQIVAQALEDKDTSGSSGEESSALQGSTLRIKVRII